MKIQRYKHELDYSYALGMTLTIELLKTKPTYVEEVIISPEITKNDNYSMLYSLCSNSNIPISQNEKAFNLLNVKGNCFVIGVFRKFDYILNAGSHIVLVNPSDSGNMGTIIRTAIGFGISQIAIIRPAVDIFDPKTVRASMGAIFHMKFHYYDSFTEYKNIFKNNNLYPFMLKASTPITEVDFLEPYSLIFGNEATGLPDIYSDYEKSTPIVIKHSHDIDSLNLTIAAGIGMFYSTRNKWHQQK